MSRPRHIDNEEESYGHVLKYTGVFGGVQGMNMIISLVRNKVAAMLLGPQGMGMASLFNSVVQFMSQSTSLGISFSAVRHVSELFDSGDEQRITHFIGVVRLWSVVTALLGMLLCVVAGPLISPYIFSWGDFRLHFVALAPAVGLMAITGGETAILKGARRLKALALVQLLNIVIALVVSVPLYYLFGQSGIVPAIVLLALFSMLATIVFSYRLYPLRLVWSSGLLSEGMGMVRLGVAFVLAGVLGSGAEMLVRSYLSMTDSLDAVGFYNSSCVLIMTIAGVVLSAIETDFFPRLSAVWSDRAAANQVVNRQIEVSLLLTTPMMAFFMVSLPVLVPLLFASSFAPVVGIAQVGAFAIVVKSVSLPVSYLTLARGDSLSFLVLESIYDVALVLLVILGFSRWGLIGTGVAYAVSYVVDVVIVGLYTYYKYSYTLSRQVLLTMALQLPLALAVYAVCQLLSGPAYWLIGLTLSALSMGVSVYVLHKKTALWAALKAKLLRRKRDED